MVAPRSTDDIFPRDTTRGPVPGTPEYGQFIDDQLTIVNADYVRSISKLSPVADEIFDELSRGAFGILSAVMPAKPIRVLDICCGAGLAVEALMNLGVEIDSLTLTEQDQRLVDRAEGYLRDKGHLPKIRTVRTAVFDPNIHRLSDRAGGEFDLVMSCNAFQHFSCEHQATLVREIYDQLSPRGVFVMQTHLKVLEPDWRNAIIEHMKAQMSATQADAAFVERAIRHTTRFHNFVPTTDVFGWCQAAGFSIAECLFRRHIISIIGAIK
jgi:SAM-dependent methyltransferase